MQTLVTPAGVLGLKNDRGDSGEWASMCVENMYLDTTKIGR